MSEFNQALEGLSIVQDIWGLTGERAQAFRLLQEDERTLENLRVLAAMPDVTEFHVSAFERLEEDRTLENFQRLAALSEFKVRVLYLLQDGERTLESLCVLAKMPDLTAFHVSAFRRLDKDHTLANFRLVASFTEAQVQVFNFLQDGERTLESLRVLAEIPVTTSHALAFHVLEEAHTLANFRRVAALPEAMALSFWWYQGVNSNLVNAIFYRSLDSKKTFDALDSVKKMPLLARIYAHVQLEAFKVKFKHYTSNSIKGTISDNIGSNALSQILLTTSVNIVVKRELAPILEDALPINIPQSCKLFLYNIFVDTSPMTSAFAVKAANSYSLMAPLSVATLYVSHAGLPQDVYSVKQSVVHIASPLVISKFLSYCGAINPPLKTWITVATLGVSFATHYKTENPNKDFYEVVTNIVDDNSDILSVGTLTYMAIAGLVTSTLASLAVSTAVATVLASGHAAYKADVVPTSVDSLYKIANTVVDPYMNHVSDMVGCLAEAQGMYS